jgi:hypothetical protein
MTNSSYLRVQMKSENGWTTVLDDADFETRLYWERVGIAGSHVTLSWYIPKQYGETDKENSSTLSECC